MCLAAGVASSHFEAMRCVLLHELLFVLLNEREKGPPEGTYLTALPDQYSMKYFIRLLLLFIISPFRKKVKPLAPCVTPFRVWPNDIDLFGHMNNGVYLTIMDLARTDMLIRSRMMGGVISRKWYPVVAAEAIRFKRSLKPFTRYEIETEVVCWDHRAFYIVQTFTQGDNFIAKAVVEARFLSTSGRKIPAADLIELAGRKEASPPMPEWIANWQSAQPAMSDVKYIEE